MRGPYWPKTTFSRGLAALVAPTASPPVVVLSLPRSGSSWVGEVLGDARDALYLREPLNQLHLNRGGRTTLFDPEEEGVSDAYEEALARCADADPRFPDDLGIVKNRRRWGIAHRRRSRVVVKEVNPYASRLLVDRLAPHLVLLVRHPAAVTLSFLRLGWWGTPRTPDRDPTSERAWRWYGNRLGEVLRVGTERLAGWDDLRAVRYEDVCLDPLERFRELAEFCELTWDRRLEAKVERKSAGGGDRGDAYATERNSRAMVDAWRAEVEPHQLRGLREGWAQHALPWYADDADW